jgi:hypothetical protein
MRLLRLQPPKLDTSLLPQKSGICDFSLSMRMRRNRGQRLRAAAVVSRAHNGLLEWTRARSLARASNPSGRK